jgi:hypothetical protein
MPMTENEVEALIKKRDVGDVLEIYGPVRFGGMWLWEIWVDNGTQTKSYYETRFLLETESNPVYFDTFVALVGYLNELYLGMSQHVGAVDWTRSKETADMHLKRITLYVASFAFVATVVSMLYLVVNNQQSLTEGRQIGLLVISTLMGLIASGAALFFGKWIPVGKFAASVSSAGEVSGGPARRSASGRRRIAAGLKEPGKMPGAKTGD